VPLCHCAIAPLCHCAIAPLCHCAIAPLRHCVIAPLRHCAIAIVPSCYCCCAILLLSFLLLSFCAIVIVLLPPTNNLLPLQFSNKHGLLRRMRPRVLGRSGAYFPPDARPAQSFCATAPLHAFYPCWEVMVDFLLLLQQGIWHCAVSSANVVAPGRAMPRSPAKRPCLSVTGSKCPAPSSLCSPLSPRPANIYITLASLDLFAPQTSSSHSCPVAPPPSSDCFTCAVTAINPTGVKSSYPHWYSAFNFLPSLNSLGLKYIAGNFSEHPPSTYALVRKRERRASFF